MKIIFWDEIISPHKSSFFNALAAYSDIDVFLFVKQHMYESRKNQGWIIPVLDSKIRLQIINNKKQVRGIMCGNDFRNAIHVFDGVISIDTIKYSFKLASKRQFKIGVISEPSNWQGIKGVLRKLREQHRAYKYDKSIDFICAVGDRGRWWFENTGYTKKKIFDWGYFIQDRKEVYINDLNTSKTLDSVNLIYVGNLYKSKGVDLLIDSFCKIKAPNIYLTIIGAGEMRETILNLAKRDSRILYKGVLPNYEVLSEIKKSSLLILPSTSKDGWGAVINEALSVGVPVIVSENCGSSVFIKKNRTLGLVFSLQEKDELYRQILFFLENRVNYEKEVIMNYYNENLTGVVAASFFLEIIDYIYNDSKVEANAPWMY